MQGHDQRAYDRGATIFSPDGRLYQVEYARAAVEQGAPAVGVRGGTGVALAAHVHRRSPLVEPRSVEKLHEVDDHVAVASAGHASDARRLVDLARRSAQGEHLRYGEPPTTGSVTTAVADTVQEHTQTGGTRPYGTGLLVAGVDDEPRLFEVDPSGAAREWRADAVGRGAADVVATFEEEYEPGLSAEGALSLAIRGLAGVVEDVRVECLDAGVVDTDGVTIVDDERLEGVLDGVSVD